MGKGEWHRGRSSNLCQHTGDRSRTRKDVQKLDCVGVSHTLAPLGEESRGQSGTRMTGSCWVRVQARECWIAGCSRMRADVSDFRLLCTHAGDHHLCHAVEH